MQIDEKREVLKQVHPYALVNTFEQMVNWIEQHNGGIDQEDFTVISEEVKRRGFITFH